MQLSLLGIFRVVRIMRIRAALWQMMLSVIIISMVWSSGKGLSDLINNCYVWNIYLKYFTRNLDAKYFLNESFIWKINLWTIILISSFRVDSHQTNVFSIKGLDWKPGIKPCRRRWGDCYLQAVWIQVCFFQSEKDY